MEEINTIIVTDLYEGAYYWLHQAEIRAITCEQVNGKISCKITFCGSNLAQLQYNFYSNKCMVNLYDFRRAYNKLNSYIYEAKKKYKQQKQTAAVQGGNL
jgi:hypothetical protein